MVLLGAAHKSERCPVFGTRLKTVLTISGEPPLKKLPAGFDWNFVYSVSASFGLHVWVGVFPGREERRVLALSSGSKSDPTLPLPKISPGRP
jgi:hypothetical protein